MISMTITSSFWLSLTFTLLSTYFAVTLNNWAAKFALFIVALGSSSALAGVLGLGLEWILLFNTFLFLATGITSVRVKNHDKRVKANVVLGILLIVPGVVLIFLTLSAFGGSAGIIQGALTQSFQDGWTSFKDIIHQTLSST
ncbi:MAG: hypothetical protein ACOH18_02590 [Candidatus Saccharimonadaceae bacterium]